MGNKTNIASSFFKYLGGVANLKYKKTTRIEDNEWYYYIHKLDDLASEENSNIKISRRNDGDNISDEDNYILKIRRPDPFYEMCPTPPSSISDWLISGWEDFHKEADYLLVKVISGEEIGFSDDDRRFKSYKSWLLKRNEWADKKKIFENSNEIFNVFHEIYSTMDRDSASLELIVADGFLNERENKLLNYPIVTKRIGIDYNAEKLEITLVDTDSETQLNSLILQDINDIDHSQINEIGKDLSDKNIHPFFDRKDPTYLSSVINKLTSKGQVVTKNDISSSTIWNLYKFLIYPDPVIILRKRIDGAPSFLNSIVSELKESDSEMVIPAHMREILFSESENEIDTSVPVKPTIEERLASVGGEDVDILLAREANSEQLEIVRKINEKNAVVVQGPPGTGKTHTISNLIGHFLAEGKSILVTSEKQQALKVLKEKLPKEIQPLCVSVLDDRNEDMEKSVDGISEYSSRYNSTEIWYEAEELKEERLSIIKDLAETRKNIFEIINKESKEIVFNDESITPTQAAKEIFLDRDSLSELIPGKIKSNTPFPLTRAEIIELYGTNRDLSEEDEKEIINEVPRVDELYTVEEMKEFFNNFTEYHNMYEENSTALKDKITSLVNNRCIFNVGYGDFSIKCVDEKKLNQAITFFEELNDIESWQISAFIASIKGGSYKKQWVDLNEQIRETAELSEKYRDLSFGKTVDVKDNDLLLSYESTYKEIYHRYKNSGKISWLKRMFNKKISEALNNVKIDNTEINSADDALIVITKIELDNNINTTKSYWNQLIKGSGGPDFDDFYPDHPEIIVNCASIIQSSLCLNENINEQLDFLGIKQDDLFAYDKWEIEITNYERYLEILRNDLSCMLKVIYYDEKCQYINNRLSKFSSEIIKGKRANSLLCREIFESIKQHDIDAYSSCYNNVVLIYEKFAAMESRYALLEKLSGFAPDWAHAIRTRDGIHGKENPPHRIEDAWRWKQLSERLSKITDQPYDELQEEASILSRRYRKVTGEYAGRLAWYHTIRRLEGDTSLRQALVGWKQTVKKIGRGTGKKAPRLRMQAREEMKRAQKAVSAWIMPISRVFETMDPKNNKFDIIIVDEASQSNIVSLGVIYLGKKIIIVGDDEQVSPTSIGIKDEEIENLQNSLLDRNLPNRHLYDAETSLYDIARTSYQPLMLIEHFRCVPDIIGYSNKLSYDFKIKPLRDSSSSNLLPAVVNFRVDGERIDKQNYDEAYAIVKLIMACIEQPEYEGMTFGIISLLGNEQVTLINKLLSKYIDLTEIDKRKIRCGNSDSFQGDERDVIFLSLVDSNESDGPLSLKGYGKGNMYKKRYNVATSRAKNQLWVVHSLDEGNDLKPGDLRKDLIQYAKSPRSVEAKVEEIKQRAESPFEEEVAKALYAKNFDIEQQYPVGSYRLDIVVKDGDKKVVVECDGERYHNGFEKISEDMERQTILERLGWRFIRIRGSEYYSDKEKAIGRIIKDLEKLEIYPSGSKVSSDNISSDLLERVNRTASEITFKEEEEFKVSKVLTELAYSNKKSIV